MRVLSTIWNIFTVSDNKTVVAPNGGSVMVYNICNSIGEKVDSYVFSGSQKNQAFDYGNVHVLANDKYLGEISSRDEITIDIWLEKIKKAFIDVLQELKPDFVLIHGGLDFSLDCICECKKKNIPFAYVSHLYEGEQNYYEGDSALRRFENNIFSMDDINIITVSDGMRLRILKEHGNIKACNIKTIRNAVDINKLNANNVDNQILKKLKANKKRILLCVGTIHPRKNQLQLVDAYKLLSDEVKNELCIVLCGKDSKNNPMANELRQRIAENKLDDSIIYLGTIKQSEMAIIYQYADGLISASLCEGLSLVVLEMLNFGKPIIMFEDNETAVDVNSETAVELIHGHSDEQLAEGIERWFYKDWNENEIIEYAKEFTMEKVADEYVDYFNRSISV